jgi:cell division protein FtsB
MEQQAVAEAPHWINVFGLILCGLVTISVVLIAVVAGFMITRRSGASSREIAELREENAQLRKEIERLKKAQVAPSSTAIKEV